jgi:uncharacterized tellurite resistance protein B-like protein
MLESLARLMGIPEEEEDMEHRLQVVTAALFVEMCRADAQVAHQEIAVALDAVRTTFHLHGDEARDLLRLAEGEADGAVSLYEFTSHINEHFSPPEKRKLIENLWRVAYADSALDKHEEYLVRKVADLIHVPHSEFMQAKHKVTSQN